MNRVKDSSDAVTDAAGARVSATGVSYRVWAPDQAEMSVLVERDTVTRPLRLVREEHGYWSVFDATGRAGDLYRFRRSDGRLLPDVASRFQPKGVHGPSECIDATGYRWRCGSWIRPGWTGQTIYEVHLGALTAAGTYHAAIEKLDQVRDLGAEAIEIMPLADFAGDRNWGYDGVALYAPARCYGRPDELRALVDAAHDRGLAVILDVVYNHLGPAGNYLPDYSADYFRANEATPWGRAFNLDGPRSRPVRDFLIGNAAYWLDEFRFDGLRLDATHAIPDRSSPHLLEEIAAAVHLRGGFLIAEDERNHAEILRLPEGGGFGLDAVWADDFHHQIRVALTGTRDAYFAAYRGTSAELASTLAHGWTYRGQSYGPWAGRARGSPCDHLPPGAFVVCIENHDQIGNRAKGERLEHLVTPRQFRAASMLLCLSPYAPLIFMGQEWAASTPFLFFTDHGGELGSQISAGRQREFAQHGLQWSGMDLPDPEAPATFTNSKLRWEERADKMHGATLALYRECLQQRHLWLHGPTLQREHWRVDRMGEFIAIRYQTVEGERLLLATFGPKGFPAGALPKNLEPPSGQVWRVVLHSEAARFGGNADSGALDDWKIAGPGAVWLEAVEEENHHAVT
ncbi:MAG TPA: malto-oligosyltrehalose trehalohydrolase [Opitutaceae bacterium]|jgi:maltooligosyltrehalose trehalohydrolase|nr:malto-oligosyltrehalose trehalohydrolase [Opitutaceae bacterium]